MEKVGIFILFLCPLVFFHELGHFLFARIFGVRVEVFSIGFGPKVFKYLRKGTQYAISIIPLGGYIKMFGDDPTAADEIPASERKYAFNHRGKWARFWIVFGGPLANFIFAYFIFVALMAGGEKVIEAKFGVINSTHIFYDKGIRTGDLLIKVDDKSILGFTDIGMSVEGDTVNDITVKRNGELLKLSIGIDVETFLNEFSKIPPRFRRPFLTDEKGRIYGISLNPNSFDKNYSLEQVFDFASVDKKFYLFPATQTISDLNPGEREPKIDFANSYSHNFELNFASQKDLLNRLNDKGFYPLDLAILKIVEESAAARAKLQVGDIILEFGDITTANFDDLRKEVQKARPGEAMNLKVMRNGEIIVLDIVPEVRNVGGEDVKAIGVYSSGVFITPRLVEGRPIGIGKSLVLGLDRTWQTIVKTVEGFKKLIVGEVSVKSMGGPIAIGKVASDSFNISLSVFFKIMAIISVNLGIVNLLPVPVLDGGHILFIFLEIVNRGPLSRRKIEIAQQFGVSLLLMLIFITLFNDVTKIIAN